MVNDQNEVFTEQQQAIINKLTPEQRQRIANELNFYFGRYKENISRILNLNKLFAAMPVGFPVGTWGMDDDEFYVDEQTRDDILRASVVFTHATLEDFLRSFAAKLLPYASESALDEIPLLGLNSTGRAEKFFLGKLTNHREKTVEQVLQESVFNSLERSNFNSIEDLAQLLKSLDVDLTEVQPLFSRIKPLMERRHLIVHRGDRVDIVHSSESKIQEINSSEVHQWIQSVSELFGILMTNLTIRLAIIQMEKNEH